MAFVDLVAEIRSWADKGHRSVGFLGGEPTIHPRLVDAVAFARGQGFTRIAIATNGRRLADSGFTDALLDAGLTRVTVSMHAHTAALEDRLTGVKGAFAQKVDALRHLLGRQSEGRLPDGVAINMVLNAWNCEHLLRIQRFFCRELGISDLRINFIRAEGNAEGSRELTPRFGTAVRQLMKAVVLNEAHYEATLTFGGFPLCVLPRSFRRDPDLVRRYVGELRDMDTDCSIRSEGTQSPGHLSMADGRARFNWQQRKRFDLKSPVKACQECHLTALCEGVWNAYLDLYGDPEFKAVGAIFRGG
jgi:MoaA/NifB/PqqE/SkfB family radical SAM enzyme